MRYAYLLVCLLFPLLVVAQNPTSTNGNGPTSTNNPQNGQNGSNQPTNTGNNNSSTGNNNPTSTGNTNNGTSPSPTVTTIFSTFTTETLGDDRVIHTITGTSTIVSTINPPGQTNGTSTTEKTTSTTSKPPPTTAAASIDGGGKLPNGAVGAPSPGASAPGGLLGPPDSYTAAALTHHANLLLGTVAGIVAGAVLVIRL